jgi:C-terminal processing protease CtpA/Prc
MTRSKGDQPESTKQQSGLTPQGLSLHGRGLDIDVQVRETPAAVRSGRDLPLEAALRLLKG